MHGEILRKPVDGRLSRIEIVVEEMGSIQHYISITLWEGSSPDDVSVFENVPGAQIHSDSQMIAG
jgi:hypothetical protein